MIGGNTRENGWMTYKSWGLSKAGPSSKGRSWAKCKPLRQLFAGGWKLASERISISCGIVFPGGFVSTGMSSGSRVTQTTRKVPQIECEAQRRHWHRPDGIKW
jgi:hypothetical protein